MAYYEQFLQPTEEEQKRGFLDNIVNLFKSGSRNAMVASRLADDVATGVIDPETAQQVVDNYMARSSDARPGELLELEGAMQSVAERRADGEGFWDTLGDIAAVGKELGSQLISNPKGFAYLQAEQIANMVPGMVGMGIGGRTGGAAGATVGPVGAAVGAAGGAALGAFIGQWGIESGAEFEGLLLQELYENGKEINTENVGALLQDEEAMASILSQARNKATGTSAVSSIMTLGSGRLMTAPMRKAWKQAAAELPKEAGEQIIGKRAASILAERSFVSKAGRAVGAGGLQIAEEPISEAAGQYAARGEFDLAEIGLETAGGIAGAFIEVPVSAHAQAAELYKKIGKRSDALSTKLKKTSAVEESLKTGDTALPSSGDLLSQELASVESAKLDTKEGAVQSLLKEDTSIYPILDKILNDDENISEEELVAVDSVRQSNPELIENYLAQTGEVDDTVQPDILLPGEERKNASQKEIEADIAESNRQLSIEDSARPKVSDEQVSKQLKESDDILENYRSEQEPAIDLDTQTEGNEPSSIPDYANMSESALKTLSLDRNLDVTGLNQKQIAAKLEADDMSATQETTQSTEDKNSDPLLKRIGAREMSPTEWASGREDENLVNQRQNTKLSRLITGVKNIWSKVDKSGLAFSNWSAPTGVSVEEDVIDSLTPSDKIDPKKKAAWVLPTQGTKPFLNFKLHNNIKGLLQNITDPETIAEIDSVARDLLVPIYGETEYNSKGWKNLLEPVPSGRGNFVTEDPAMAIFSVLTGGVRIRVSGNGTEAVVTMRTLPTKEQIRDFIEALAYTGSPTKTIRIDIQNGLVEKSNAKVFNVTNQTDLRQKISRFVTKNIGGIYFKRGEQATGKGLTTTAINKILGKYIAGWKNLVLGENLHIFRDTSSFFHSAPPDVRRYIKNNGIDIRSIPSFYMNGEVYIIAPNIKTEKDAIKAVLHEGVAHFGLRGIFKSEELKTFLQQVVDDVGIANIREYLTKEGYVFDHIPKNKSGDLRLAEEYIATMAEQRDESIKQTWKDLKALIRRILNRMFGKEFKWSDAELNAILKKAKHWTKSGESPQGMARYFDENIPAMQRMAAAMFFSPMKAFVNGPNGIPKKGTASEYIKWFDSVMGKTDTSARTTKQIRKSVTGGYIKRSEYTFSGVGPWLQALAENSPDHEITVGDITRLLDEVQFTIRPYSHGQQYNDWTLKDGRDHPEFKYYELVLQISTKEMDVLLSEWDTLEKRKDDTTDSDERQRLGIRQERIVTRLGKLGPLPMKGPQEVNREFATGSNNSHFGGSTYPLTNTNELAHVRFAIHKLKDGSSTLQIAEIQSDWIQGAYKYGSPENRWLSVEEAKEIGARKNSTVNLNNFFADLFNDDMIDMLNKFEHAEIDSSDLSNHLRNLTYISNPNSYVNRRRAFDVRIEGIKNKIQDVLDRGTNPDKIKLNGRAIAKFFTRRDGSTLRGLKAKEMVLKVGGNTLSGKELWQYETRPTTVSAGDVVGFMYFHAAADKLSKMFAQKDGYINEYQAVTDVLREAADFVSVQIDGMATDTFSSTGNRQYDNEKIKSFRDELEKIRVDLGNNSYELNILDEENKLSWQPQEAALRQSLRDDIPRLEKRAETYNKRYETAEKERQEIAEKYPDGYPYPPIPFNGQYENDVSFHEPVLKYLMSFAANSGVNKITFFKHLEQLSDIERWNLSIGNDELYTAYDFFQKLIRQRLTDDLFAKWPYVKDELRSVINKASQKELESFFGIKIKETKIPKPTFIQDSKGKTTEQKGFDTEYTVEMEGLVDPLLSGTKLFEGDTYFSLDELKDTLLRMINGDVLARTPNIFKENVPTFSFKNNKVLDHLLKVVEEREATDARLLDEDLARIDAQLQAIKHERTENKSYEKALEEAELSIQRGQIILRQQQNISNLKKRATTLRKESKETFDPDKRHLVGFAEESPRYVTFTAENDRNHLLKQEIRAIQAKLDSLLPTEEWINERLRELSNVKDGNSALYDNEFPEEWRTPITHKRIWERYKKDIPAFLNSYLRQWGVKLQNFTLDRPVKVLPDGYVAREPGRFGYVKTPGDNFFHLIYNTPDTPTQTNFVDHFRAVRWEKELQAKRALKSIRSGRRILAIEDVQEKNFSRLQRFDSTTFNNPESMIETARQLFTDNKFAAWMYSTYLDNAESWGSRALDRTRNGGLLGDSDSESAREAIEMDISDNARMRYQTWLEEEGDEDTLQDLHDGEIDVPDEFYEDGYEEVMEDMAERINRELDIDDAEQRQRLEDAIVDNEWLKDYYGLETKRVSHIYDTFSPMTSPYHRIQKGRSTLQQYKREVLMEQYDLLNGQVTSLRDVMQLVVNEDDGYEDGYSVGIRTLEIKNQAGKVLATFTDRYDRRPDHPHERRMNKLKSRLKLKEMAYNFLWDMANSIEIPVDAKQEVAGFEMNEAMLKDLREDNVPLFKRVEDTADAVNDDAVFSDELSEQSLLDKVGSYWGSLKNFTELKNNFITQTFDKLRPILDKIDKGVQEIDMRSYTQFRMMSNINNILSAFLLHGKLKFVNRNSLQVTDKNNGFYTYLKKLKGKDATNALKWIAAKRADTLLKEDERVHRNHPNLRKFPEGKVGRFTREAIDNVLNSDWAQKGPDTKDTTWDDINNKLQEFNKNVLDLAEESGLITKEARQVWEQHYYIPFYKVLEDESMIRNLAPRASKKNISANIQKLIGSDEALGDPLTNLLRSWGRLIESSMRNLAMERAYENGLDSGAVIGFTDKEGNYSEKKYMNYLKEHWRAKGEEELFVLSFQKDGETVRFRVEDPELFNALADVRFTDFDNLLVRFLRGGKRLLTFGVTFGIPFRIANFLRDSFSTYLVERDFIPIIDSFRGLLKVMRNDDSYLALASSGSTFSGGFLDKHSGEELKKLSRELIRNEGSGVKAKTLDTPRKLLKFWEDFGMALEMAARTQLYANLTQKGQSLKGLATGQDKLVSHLEGAFRAKDLLDFNKSGAAKSVNLLIQMMPFLNARLQGLHKIGQQGVGTEGKTAFYLKGLALSAASLVLWGAFKDDDRYKQLKDWEKWNYYHFWIGDEHYRIPKPFELGLLFSAMPEALGNIMNENEDMQHGLDLFLHALTQTLSLDPIPQAIRPTWEVWSNRSHFFKRDIVPQHMKNKAKEEQTYPWTSDTLQAMGRQFGLSPLQTEYLINGYMGAFGMFLLGMTDIAYRTVADPPEKPQKKWYETPVTKRFIKDASFPNADKAVESLYGLFQDAEQLASLMQSYRESGDFEAMRKLRSENIKVITYRSFLRKRVKMLAQYRKRVHDTYKSKRLTPKQKRTKIDALTKQRNTYMLQLYKTLTKLEEK